MRAQTFKTLGDGMKNLEITQNINIIESLKSELLYKVADIFQNQSEDGSHLAKDLPIADLMILLYLLASKMGYSYDSMDAQLQSRLTAAIVSEQSAWQGDLSALKEHLSR